LHHPQQSIAQSPLAPSLAGYAVANIGLTCAARSAKRIGALFAERSDSKKRDKGQDRLKPLLD